MNLSYLGDVPSTLASLLKCIFFDSRIEYQTHRERNSRTAKLRTWVSTVNDEKATETAAMDIDQVNLSSKEMTQLIDERAQYKIDQIAKKFDNKLKQMENVMKQQTKNNRREKGNSRSSKTNNNNNNNNKTGGQSNRRKKNDNKKGQKADDAANASGNGRRKKNNKNSKGKGNKTNRK